MIVRLDHFIRQAKVQIRGRMRRGIPAARSDIC